MTSTNTGIRKGMQTRQTSSAHPGVRTSQPRKKIDLGVAVVVSCKQAVKSEDNHTQTKYSQTRPEGSTSVDKRKLSTIAGSSPNSKHHGPARNTGRYGKKGTMQQRAFLLDLPDELLLLIVQETARRGVVKIQAPERRRKRASDTKKMQPPIYHLSLVSQRIRSVCWEFLFQNIEFSLRCDTHGYISEGDMAYLKQKFQDHRPNVLESIRRISFSSAEPEVHCAFEMDYKIHQFQPFALDIIRLCPNLCRISLPAFYSLNQLCQHEALLQAASEHSPNLLVVYHELGRDPGFGDISRPLSRVVLSSLDTSRYNYRTTNWTKRLLERASRNCAILCGIVNGIHGRVLPIQVSGL
ncbi:hypothetical protein VKT23_001360 [Stygiomarasmius scandens]|uniref:F-box domain-containing protein n=1 Tax=Marasmiellus scandens TaxID=2682957 RepID=A0ABR1K7V5_9AGAR